MRVLCVAILAIATITSAGGAQSTKPPAGVVAPQPINQAEPEYADTTRAAGVQGTATVRGIVQLDGTITDVTVTQTSRSQVLDDAAVAALRQWRFTPASENNQAVVAPLEVAFEFAKDHLSNIDHKTCADLNADVAYFRATFPELPISAMRIRALSMGIPAILHPRVSVAGARRIATAFEPTVAWCADHPGELYLAHFMHVAGF